MKAKTVILRTVKIVSLVVAVALCVHILTVFLFSNIDNNAIRIDGFYTEERESLDVVIIGASEVYYDLAPGYAYEKYGIRSYGYGNPSTTSFNYKTALKEVIRAQNPKLIYIELNGCYYDDVQLDTEGNTRNFCDHLPLNMNKIEYINENVHENQLEYYFPIAKFHSVWRNYPSELGWTLTMIQNRLRGYSLLKGIRTKNEAHSYKESNQIKGDKLLEKTPLNKRCQEDLIELLDYCKEQQLTNVIFGRMPHNVEAFNYERFKRSNTAKEIVESYGYDFVCFDVNEADTDLDITTDFDNLEHLNIYGARKFTTAFCEYIMEHYGITPGELSEKQKAEWEECARYYEAFYACCEDRFKTGNTEYLCEDYHNMKIIEQYLK